MAEEFARGVVDVIQTRIMEDTVTYEDMTQVMSDWSMLFYSFFYLF